MDSQIERRLRALEGLAGAKKPSVFLLRAVSPGGQDRPVTRIRHGDQEWHRRDDESEDTFRLRAEAEAVLPTGYSAFLMLMD